jgi:hypothetical protein
VAQAEGPLGRDAGQCEHVDQSVLERGLLGRDPGAPSGDLGSHLFGVEGLRPRLAGRDRIDAGLVGLDGPLVGGPEHLLQALADPAGQSSEVELHGNLGRSGPPHSG